MQEPPCGEPSGPPRATRRPHCWLLGWASQAPSVGQPVPWGRTFWTQLPRPAASRGSAHSVLGWRARPRAPELGAGSSRGPRVSSESPTARRKMASTLGSRSLVQGPAPALPSSLCSSCWRPCSPLAPCQGHMGWTPEFKPRQVVGPSPWERRDWLSHQRRAGQRLLGPGWFPAAQLGPIPGPGLRSSARWEVILPRAGRKAGRIAV